MSIQSLEFTLSKLAEMEEFNKENLWAKADLIAAVMHSFGGECAGSIADVLACSKPHVKLLGKMSRTFTSQYRYPDTPWGIYLLCAGTDTPVSWLERAVENRWSIKDLKEALAEEKEEVTAQEALLKLAQKVAAKAGYIASIDPADPVFESLRELLGDFMQAHVYGPYRTSN